MENMMVFEEPMTAEKCSGHLSSVEDAIYVIGGKWKLKIIIVLQERGNIRFNELQRNIPGISARVLSNELKDLELNGFVKRVVHAEQMPVVVEYISTDYSRTLKPVIMALSEWGRKHKKNIREDLF
ncbi:MULTISPECIES: winged helix-turn-helix transcriptional regulator [Chryseobacterium]|jgi:DNA-binding HxlR family transcriptional regulator|uniref:HxlR family transcriptional regulator n=2 Tax=Chryseobacterium aquaticum TaxID=452084 RepID=A0A124F268_9FLAO|nr:MULTISPECIES: helix-turn-helix domain-containing protein [Chryseobacterium]KNB63173.1 HxlR family transcriptional regulator [Chryseobacterium sp. Hurlbut01]KUJ53865.1 HxlR family transcriptional regulator [Chryseobacterium aquaticum subsp. greenlandense]NMR35869.1 helix-turn-helix transcriptional regulator [Chryseobacterium aquaticum]NRQ47882.1 helix-turn-helix transcriptional regulator [Chryseobacterium sp. C-204]